MEERLQKIIARAGVASRRASEELILAGRVRVNGHVVTELGLKADRQKDRIEVDGKRLVSEVPVYVALHKPRNVVSTLRDPEGRPTVADYVRGTGARLYPVGRLDFATSGILLMTNDGDFANALLHPRGGVPKTYVLKVQGVMSDDDLTPWREGIRLEDGVTLPAEARLLRREGDKTWLEVTLREGRNQQIRRMGEATGWPVMRLARTTFAGVTSEGLRPGEWRALTVDELLHIREAFGVPKRIRGAMMGASSGPVDHRRVAGAARSSAKAPPRPAPEAAGPAARSRTPAPSRARSRTGADAPGAPGPGPAQPRARSRANIAPPSAPGAPTAQPRARSRANIAPPGAPGPGPARSARNARSETKPRGAETRGPRARGPGRH
ncbi:pseudouridine synthase [Sorangium cellulosum]|uniref:Pseudouridine synthase n=1 Tax=Sorangium cellulosum TaxID=56 RepID=A0A150Q6U0_SORCE|nr:pseudouridine synthase [Sorangium cellulosum]KYF63675.1 pseudouridine synthase [Sorangium cellulosum]